MSNKDTAALRDYLTKRKLMEFLGIPYRTLVKTMEIPTFPKPIRIGTRDKWRRDEIEAYFRL